MKTLAFRTTTQFINVIKNEDGTLSIFNQDGQIENAGHFIASMGGIDAVLKRCEEYSGSFADFVSEIKEREAIKRTQREIQNTGMMQRIVKIREERELKEEAEWLSISGLKIIPATVDNIRILLTHLNKSNWGTWNLPSLSIGYSANQFDCDGVSAATIVLDKAIDFEGKMIDKFKVGGKRGYLVKYQSL